MTNHLPVLPILVPLVAGLVCLAASRVHPRFQRLLSLLGILGGGAAAVMGLDAVAHGEILVYHLGDWPAPFGIVLVLDRLSAVMVALVSVVALAVWWSSSHPDRDAPYLHPLLQLQLLGVNGAFLTGDLFNLFVFFEILLIASYGLMLWGVRREQLRAGIAYVAVNLAGSTLFLIAIGMVYGITGTLNLADLAVKIGALGPNDQAIAESAALLLAVVFGLKAALAPLHLWLPAAYGAASTPVAILLALMTKVGVYALLRVHGQVFGLDAGALSKVAVPWLVAAALVTIVVATAAALAATNLRRLVAALLIASVGVMVAAVGQLEPQAAGAGLYYLLQSTLVIAALLSLSGTIAARRGEAEDRLVASEWHPGAALMVVFLVGAVAVAGLPPLAGFLGKALILQATLGQNWLWLVVLTAGLANLVAVARAGMALFWDSPAGRPDKGAPPVVEAAGPPLAPAAFLLAVVLALSVLAGPVAAFTRAAAEQALDPSLYVEAVLGASP